MATPILANPPATAAVKSVTSAAAVPLATPTAMQVDTDTRADAEMLAPGKDS